MKNNLTILMPTHFIPSAPSISLIKKVLNGLQNYAELDGCKLIISYDMPFEETATQVQYHLNLQDIKCKYNLQVDCLLGAQQRKSVLSLICQVNTPYLLFLEHDWWFTKKFDFRALIKVMDKYPGINYIGFNKRANQAVKADYVLKADPMITELPLLKTSRWSNNPYIARTKTWRDTWMSLVINAPINKKIGHSQVEGCLGKPYKKEIKTKGFDEAHKNWGCYLYGKMNDAASVFHLDGKTWK